MRDQDYDDQITQDFIDSTAQEMKAALKNDPLYGLKALLSDNETLRDLAKSNGRAFNFAAVVALAAIVAAFAGWSRDEKYRYFYINSRGHVYETHGLSYPTATKVSVIDFAEEIALKIHTWTYRNYYENFTELFDYCEKKVIEAYYNKLGSDGLFKTAERYKQHYDSAVSASRIEQERTIDDDGRRQWRLNITINEEITGATNPVNKTYNMIIDVSQVPLSVSPRGLQCVHLDENYKK